MWAGNLTSAYKISREFGVLAFVQQFEAASAEELADVVEEGCQDYSVIFFHAR